MSGPWERLLGAALGPQRALREALADPEDAQRRLLSRLLQAAQGATFAEAHGLDPAMGVEAFRARVPVRDHAALSQYIARMARGEANVLFPGLPVVFERTGGCSGGAKLIPYSEAALGAFRGASLAWIGELAARRPEIARGRAYLALSQPRPAERTPGGTPVGMGSDAAYLGADLARAAAEIVVAPVAAGDRDAGGWRATTAAALCECPELSFVSVWSPTFLLTILDALASEFDAVALRLSPQARRRLESAMRRGRLDARALWPALACVSCWTDGASVTFAHRLAAALPGVAIEPKGLVSTEAVVTAPYGAGPGAPPALPWTLLEFLGEDGEFAMSHQLRIGARYAVVVTTFGGLFRYDTGDMVECVAKQGAVPRLSFAGRRDRTCDMVGEKLADAFVTQALAGVGLPGLLVPRALPQPRYDLLVECRPGEAAEAARRADLALRANPQYAFARDFGQLGAPVALRVESLSVALARAAETRGLRMGDAKPSGLGDADLAQALGQADLSAGCSRDTGSQHEDRSAVP